MADIKWIKLSIDIFNNRKIKQIRKLPDGDAITVIWLNILCLAGQINDNGLVYFSRDVPYSEEMLATEFDRSTTLVRMALDIFERFGMIEIVDSMILVSNWEKYQSVDKLERIREQTRKRVASHRAKQKALSGGNATVTLPVTQCNATELELEEELEPEEDIYTRDKQPQSKKPTKHKHGEYNNVLLTDEELDKLKAEFTDWQDRIDRLSGYVASTGKKYKSHYATIRQWAAREKKEDKPNGTSIADAYGIDI